MIHHRLITVKSMIAYLLSSNGAVLAHREARLRLRGRGQQPVHGEGLIPLVEVEVAGADGGGPLVAFGDEIVQVLVGRRAQRLQAEVVNDQESHAREHGELAVIGAGGARRSGFEATRLTWYCNQYWLGVQYLFQEAPPMQQTFRQFYQPKPDRTPVWLRRLWSWL